MVLSNTRFCARALLCGAALAAILPAAALAQTAPAQGGTADAANLADIIVTGSRSATRRAEAEQRQADIVSEVISADELLTIPSTSVAAALKRLPGVSTVNDRGTGDARYVSIRGLDSALNVYTMNGVRLATSGRDNRAVALDLLPPDGLDTVRVVKSVTPDLDGDAVGGTIDFRLPSPFDFGDGMASLSVRASRENIADKTATDLTGAFSTFLDSDRTLGLYGVVFHTERTITGERNENISYNTSWRPNGLLPDSDTVLSEDTPLRLVSHGLDRFVNDIDRTGGNFTLEYRPTSNDELHLRGLYSQWKNDQLHDYIDVKTGQDDKGAINSFSSLMGAEVKQEDNRLGVLNLGGRHVRSAFELDYDIAYTYGRTETPNQWYMEYVTDGSLPIYSTPIGFDASDSKHPTWVMSEAQSSAMLNPANLKFDYAELYRRISEDSQAYAAVNLAWSPEDKGVLKTVKGGFRFRRSQRDYDQQQDVDSGTRDIPGLAGGSPLSDHSDLIAGSIDHFDDDHYRGLTRFGTILEMNRVLAVLQAAPRVTDDEYPWNLNDSSGRETSYSGYAMAVLERGAWSATAGARVERTDIHNEALVTTEDAVTGVVTREFGGATGTTEASYTQVLPSLHVDWRPNADWTVRAAVWTSFARPNFTDISKGINIESNGPRIVSIAKGNPDLKPAEALNFDLGVQYAGEQGFLSVGLFRKEIDNFIYQSAGSQVMVGADGVPITTSANGKDATIWGVELAGRRDLIAGFSAWANYTYQPSKADPGIAWREGVEVGLPNAPKVLGNVGLSYKRDRFDADLGYSYRGRYIATLRANALDEYIQPQATLDFGARLQLTDQLVLSAYGENLTGEAGYWATRGKSERYTIGYQTAPRMLGLGLTWRH
ncbi:MULTISPECIES: TonB-dependent receptor [Brevundimonas]|jgi:TonB-dependent receptor|uniref:TonB-dependent receptor n=1 Tax=Brevundimonas TaxID=41275 RepID=UPI00128EC50B|nr:MULTISPECIES: TonB-dependent receptor [Brevundimonas]QFU31137.1 Colicin I receptor precursor [Brevundimonas sp. Bb-A]